MAVVAQASHVRNLAELNERIRDAESMRAGVLEQRERAEREASANRKADVYRRLQQRLRAPSAAFNLWPLGLILLGSLTPGGLAFAFSQILTGSYGFAFFLFLAVTIGAAGLLARILFVPNDAALDAMARDAHERLETARATVDRFNVELSRVDLTLRRDTEARDATLRSVQYKRELLLQENWKAMRGPEFEVFLVEAFHLLGGIVERTGGSGDQGVDLVVAIGKRRYAVQAKGYVSAVSNLAVQEAVAGMAHYRCNCSMVITNSRFTQGAIELAASNCCVLIDEDELAAFVLGTMELK